jgi:hypothetical protein
MIYAAKQSNVDVINMSIGGLPALNDGNNARAILYNNLIETYNVQMFLSAGNSGPGMNTIGDPSVATLVMSVGAYITDDTYLAAYGAQLYEADNLHYFSSRGPREDGGFKPEIVAPGAAISTTNVAARAACADLPPDTLRTGPPWRRRDGRRDALLLSAAEQDGAQRSRPRSAGAQVLGRYLPGYQAYEQGKCLINVAPPGTSSRLSRPSTSRRPSR